MAHLRICVLLHLYDHLFVPNVLHEPLVEGREFLGSTDQRAPDRLLCRLYRRVLVGHYASRNLSFVGDLLYTNDCSIVLTAVHDCLAHPAYLEVSPTNGLVRTSMFPSRPGPEGNTEESESRLTDYTARLVAWYLLGLSGCASPILYSTVNSIVRDDSEERALILVRIRSLSVVASSYRN